MIKNSFLIISFSILVLMGCHQDSSSDMPCAQQLLLADFDLQRGVITQAEYDQRISIIAINCGK
ncbi:hypothetical protein EHQ81_12640 [Leptospira selangorensis]|uniref:Uncharacterized protein n=1 Tax=Leptospira selangorensis TaxID=2484982 RepID=A0A5F2C7W8_9LEPT|nr:hypothetical protein [Leptospira selangorensis]TGM12734.1 hypothetical protein EHQ81_12640 [Leptospira selangorensis]TGM30795.1 hypothetical protein EHQ82_00480 [Leptospira selangorensis]